MRTLAIENTVYNYSDLLLAENSELKEKVLSNLSDINIDFEWYSSVYESFTEIALENGFVVDKCYFSGFYSQGDGAMFEGMITDFSQYISNNLVHKLYKNDTISLEASFKHSGHYYHEKSYSYVFDYDFGKYGRFDNIETYLGFVEDHICDKYESLCKELYTMLKYEYEYLTSESSILETIEMNGYEFDEEGNII